ncbi:MAG TPA: FecR domain-containing protein [Rhizomicrobium sp.]|nr:FecR domain-containing protein [Rhizomicrobium sp.]
MTDAHAETAHSKADARDVERRAASWLERRERADWGAADQAEFDAWIGASIAHRVAYVRVDAAWSRAEWLKDVHPFGSQSAPRRKMFSPLLLRVAATLALAAALGAGAAYYFGHPRDRIYSTPVGGHEIVAFADGTKIELDTDTVLRARMTTKSRTIWLDKGEAYFQVKHDASHPFVVIAGDRRVTDLGTKFLIRRDPGRLEVALMEGRVRVGAEGEKSQSALLKPGDVITATASTVFLTEETHTALARELSWRRGVLVFDKTPLADAAREFNRYNSVKIIIADPAVASMTIDGTFPANNSEAFARVVRNALGLRVERHGDESVIYR